MCRTPGIDWAWNELPGYFPEFGESERWLPLLRQHHQLLQEAAARVPVTAVAEGAAPLRLYGESLETIRLALGARGPGGTERVLADVGSGGGFPGLVAAAVLPDWQVVLIESLRKRAMLMRDMAASLGLNNVEVIAERAETAGRDPRLRDGAAIVTARAVAELRVVLEYTAPLCSGGGVIALPKGSRLPAEVTAAERAMAELGVKPIEESAMREEISATPWTMLLRKLGTTPERYPRRPGLPQKRPL